MSTEPAILNMDDNIITRVITLVGFLLIACGSSRSYVILNFLGEILIPFGIVLLLWMINLILMLAGLLEIVAALQVFRGKFDSGKLIISIGLLMGVIVLVTSAAQQVVMPLHFYDFIYSDLIGWIGIGLAALVRLNMK